MILKYWGLRVQTGETRESTGDQKKKTERGGGGNKLDWI